MQFTFACVAMTGEVCNRGAAVFLSAVFSGAATPAPWASAAVGHPLRVCCAAGRSPSCVHDDAATAGAVAGAALQLSRRRERQRERKRECTPVGALVGRRRPLTQRFRRYARVSAVGCLYACCLGCLEPECGCAQLEHVFAHLPLCPCAWLCAMLRPFVAVVPRQQPAFVVLGRLVMWKKTP